MPKDVIVMVPMSTQAPGRTLGPRRPQDGRNLVYMYMGDDLNSAGGFRRQTAYLCPRAYVRGDFNGWRDPARALLGVRRADGV